MGIVPLLDLTRQIRSIESECESALWRVMRRGHFILGPEVSRFEKEFSRFCQTSFGAGVASGTDALELALRACGVGPGHLVATVSFTFLATVDAILHVGAEPLFVDIDPLTYTMSPESLDREIRRLSPTQRRCLKAILPVHLYGHPCDMDALGRITRKHRLALVEDAAQAAGARWRGKPVGSFGMAGCFSFFPSKNLGAFGDAGMVVTNSSTIASRIRSLRVHGRGPDGRQELLGRNSRLDELQAAILRVKRRHLTRWLRLRQEIACLYTNHLSPVPGIICPTIAPNTAHAFCLYVIRSKQRDAIKTALARRGIATQIYYDTPVHRQPLHRRRYGKLFLPQTNKASCEVLALPIYPELSKKEVLFICRAIEQALL